MSVLKNKRNTAFSEFERQAMNLVTYTKERLNRLPSRYEYFILPRIYNPINKALAELIFANEIYGFNEASCKKRNEHFQTAVWCLQNTQKPLFSAWNILDVEEESSLNWANKINIVIALIWGVTKWNKREMPMIIPLPKKKMQKLEFLKTMGELHLYTYKKIGHAPRYCRDTLSSEIAMFIDTALYEIIIANYKQPTTKAEAQARAEHLQAAIDNLNALQRPLFALWLVQDYSEHEMNDWSGLIDKELKLLEGLKKSDVTRFKSLK